MITLSPIEQVMIAALEAGEQPDPGRFGGPGRLLEAVPEISASPLFPEFLRMALAALADADGASYETLSEFVCRIVESAGNGCSWMEAIDLLDGTTLLPESVIDRSFSRFLSLAIDPSAEPLARAAGLDGALRWSLSDRKRQLRLIGWSLRRRVAVLRRLRCGDMA